MPLNDPVQIPLEAWSNVDWKQFFLAISVWVSYKILIVKYTLHHLDYKVHNYKNTDYMILIDKS